MKNRLAIIGSYILFISMIIWCLNEYKDFSITDNAISNFGINKSTKYPFAICIITLSLVSLYVQQSVNFKRGIKKLLIIGIRFGAVISSISLIVIATIDMSNSVHNFFAFTYFIFMPLLALAFGIVFRLEGDRTLSTYLFIIAISNIVISFTLYKLFSGFFISELIHTQFVFLYVYLLDNKCIV